MSCEDQSASRIESLCGSANRGKANPAPMEQVRHLCEHTGRRGREGRIMSEANHSTGRKRARRLMTLTLALGLTASMMYVSFAFGFRAGIAEDTIFIMPQC